MAILFEIYRGGQRVRDYAPVAATAVGNESIPIPGDVVFEKGLLQVRGVEDPAVGVSLLWDMGAPGELVLETTRLLQRPEPYVLNVELARARLMRIVQKQEDWNLFDFPKAERFTEAFRAAQSKFADALCLMDDPAAASAVADESLAMAVDLSEQLSTFHAELLMNRRRATGQFVRHVFGCRADCSLREEKFKEHLAERFEYAVVPMSWKTLQPQEGTFETAATDEWIEYLGRRRIPVIAGPLIGWDDRHVPEWLFIWENDYDTIREMAYEYVHRVVHRYRKGVAMWNVGAGLHKKNAFALSFEQMIDLTRLLVAQVKTIIPNARTLVTITHAFGEYHAEEVQGVPPLLYAEMAAQAGINFEAFGLELEMGVPEPGRFTRDLFQLSCLLDRFSTLGRPVFITGIGVPGQSTPDPADASGGANDPSRGGRWRRPWDPDLQADWMEAVYQLALSKPYVESIAWGNLADPMATVPGGGLLTSDLEPKPACLRLQEIRESIRGRKG